jgi:CHAT domain-containing protein
MQRPRPERILRPLISSVRCVSGLAVVCMLAGCSRGSASTDQASRLAAALESVPGVAPRLSLPTAFRRCSEQAPDEGTITRADCPPRRSSRRPLVALARALPAGDNAAALHARAIVDLVVPDERGISLDRSISSLRRLEAMVDRPAPVLADLSAALIVRAERTQAPRDLLEAYEIAEQALKDDPRNVAALYNRALALERFGLVDETARDWQAYLAADSTSAWADDAQRRRRTLLAIQPPPRPAPDAPLAEYARYAATDPQGARELGMDHLLGEWGAAVEAGDSARAADRLARAAALGETLEARPGGDASLADAVSAIRAIHGDAPALRSLARAHSLYAAAMVLYDSSQYVRAEPRFASVATAPAASPALRGWAQAFWGTVRVHNRAAEEGVRILRLAVSAIDPDRHPALAARARWSLGNTLGRGEEWEQALEHARESARLFGRAGEKENEGAAGNVVTYARFVLGEPDSAYSSMHGALDRLKQYRTSVRLHSLFTAGTPLVENDGLASAALRLQNEGVTAAARMGGTIQIVEARAARARLLITREHDELARADIRIAHILLPAVDDSVVRRWLHTDLRHVEALASLRHDPQQATAAMDSAAEYFAAIPVKALPYLVGGAEARLVAGDPGGAITRLDRAIQVLDRRRDSIRIEPRRAAVFDAARMVVDRIVMLKLADGRPAEALDYMDRGRASLASAGSAVPVRGGSLAAPPGEVVVVYALVADTLLAWTVSGNRVDVFRAAVDTMRLTRAIDEAEARLQRQDPVDEVRPLLSTLYEWLLRPVEGRLGNSGTRLVIVADGILSSVPFAALYDVRGKRYFIEEHPLRHAVSLREARRIPPADGRKGVLLVADPAFDPREHPLLNRLHHVPTEVQEFAAGYEDAVVLDSANATPHALVAALRSAGVAHFAGHAVFDDERPERSYLVLAPESKGPGRITAEELGGLDLRGVRLVVLAACRTIRSGEGRAAGFTGLAGALLAAGADGTVGSTWDVDDRLTASLMAEFHRRYRASRDGPGALRQAQLALLRSDVRALQSPAAWAGFRYTGR